MGADHHDSLLLVTVSVQIRLVKVTFGFLNRFLTVFFLYSLANHNNKTKIWIFTVNSASTCTLGYKAVDSNLSIITFLEMCLFNRVK